MKTICIHTPAAWMLAGLAALMAAGTLKAEEPGTARITDDGVESADADSDLVIRGASDLRRRNAQTSQAMRRMFRDRNVKQTAARRPSQDHRTPGPSARRPATPPIRRVSGAVVAPPVAGCAPDGCCPGCGCPAGDCCCDSCCACPAGECCCPAPCCEPCCACPAGGCCCPQAGECCCPAGECCCPQGGACCCPAGDCCCPGTCDGCCPCGAGCRCGNGYDCGCHGACSHCQGGSCLNNNCFADFLCGQAVAHRARNRMASATFGNYVRCKLGYFIPSGNGGIGSPLMGRYHVVYPVDPNYFDGRDGQVYAAQGYGGAVSVPLAPVVRHAYNYGWGVPSSRLTPVSNTTP